MTLLPVVERELRTASRRSGTYLSRSLLALAAFLIVAGLLLGLSDMVHPTRLSMHIFQTLTYVELAFAAMSGMFLTADCLSEEKRAGTLGLLFLTDLKGWDVVFGKLAGTSLLGIFGFLAVLPMLALPVMFGGVSWRQFCQVSVALGVIMALSLATGLLFSAAWKQSRHVVGATFFMALLTAVGLELPSQILKFLLPMNPVHWIVRLPSSLSLLEQAMSPFPASWAVLFPWYFWSLSAHVALAATAFAGACWLLPRRWQEVGSMDKLSSDPRNGMSPMGLVQGFMAVPARLKNGLNPFCWLTLRTTGPDPWSWLLLIFGGTSFLILYAYGIQTRGHGYFAAAMFVAFGLHFVFKVLLALSMVRRLTEDRNNGSLELILSTPLDPKTLLLGHRAALRVQWKWAVLGLLLVNLLLIAAALGSSLFWGEDSVIFFQFFVGGAILLFLDVAVMEVVGPWMALIHAKPARAAWATLARVMGPGFAGIFAVVLCSFDGGSSRIRILHLIWLGLSVASGMWMWNAAQRRLTRSFRDYAAGLISEKFWFQLEGCSAPESSNTRAVPVRSLSVNS